MITFYSRFSAMTWTKSDQFLLFPCLTGHLLTITAIATIILQLIQPIDRGSDTLEGLFSSHWLTFDEGILPHFREK